MKPFPSIAEKKFLEDLARSGRKFLAATRGLSIGEMVRLIRNQLGMSQLALSKISGVPQSTISRLERGESEIAISTLNKILESLSCDLSVGIVLRKPIDDILFTQAEKIAKKNAAYLQGTMSLEEQATDNNFMQELIKREIQELTKPPNKKLWD